MHGVPADATSDDEVVVDLGELETETQLSDFFLRQRQRALCLREQRGSLLVMVCSLFAKLYLRGSPLS